MVLADTSVWIEHLARRQAMMPALLERGDVLMHPFVLAEISLGSMPRRAVVLSRLSEMMQAPLVDSDEVQTLIEKERLFGRGIGYVDCHLLASARLMDGVLWTFDQRLHRAARDLRVAYKPSLN
jgi:predicted nucleic acid-binding protein